MALGTDPSVTILAVGTTVATTGSSSAITSIPPTLNGNVPVKIRVSATFAACICLGTAGSCTATTNHAMVQPGDALILRVPVGITKFAVIQVSAAGAVQVSPCEDA